MPTILQAITESTTLGGLLNRIDQSKACLEIVLKRLPLSLHTSLAPGPIKDKEWCLLINNASAIAKLKQLEPIILAALRANGMMIERIRLKRSYVNA